MKPFHGLRVVSVEQVGAAPIKINDGRHNLAPCSPMGADNGTYLREPSVAKRVGAP
ncbi:MAG TPA: hypothetical protein VKB68_01145 [Stellaceae bacterium]|nr:hypothetical protein [Stellaceae bacterium]